MTPSTWPALIVGVFTLLQPSTAVAPATETPALTVVLTTALPVSSQAPSPVGGETFSVTGAVDLNAPLTFSGTGGNGSFNPILMEPSTRKFYFAKTGAKLFDLNSIDPMPNCWKGGDPNQMDQMAVWDGSDPNKIDHMAYGYDPTLVKFYNSGGTSEPSTISIASGDWDKYLKNFSPLTPPAVPKDTKPQSFVVPPALSVPGVPAPPLSIFKVAP